MEVEDKPDVTYDDVGGSYHIHQLIGIIIYEGSKKALEQLREVVEIPLLHPERYNKRTFHSICIFLDS